MSKYSRSSSFDRSLNSPMNRVPFNNVLIEVFYSIMFSHHVPMLFRQGGFFGNIQLIDFSSISSFFQSYIGKVLFFILVFSILHYIVLPRTRKIDLNKYNKDLNK